MNKITTLINKFFGGGVISDILDKIVPDKIEKLKIEQQIRTEMYNVISLEFKDIESAREMQIEALKQNDNFSKRFVYILSICVLANTILAGILAFFFEFPIANRDLITQYYSFSFIAGGAQVISFFFGKNNNNNNFK